MEKHILELQQVSKVYGTVNALTAIDLHVREGEWLAIMGPSGSGKTTLMNIIGCMDKPSFGKVVLDGQDVTAATGQDRADFPAVSFGLVSDGIGKRDDGPVLPQYGR